MKEGINRRDLFKRTAYAGAAATTLPGLAAFLAACANGTTSNTSGSSNGARSGIKLAAVTHGQASDPFWSVVKNGMAQGSKDMGVQYTYDAPTKFDMVAMSQLIDTQVARKPDGLLSVCRLTYHAQITLHLQGLAKEGAKDRVIVCDQDPHRGHLPL